MLPEPCDVIKMLSITVIGSSIIVGFNIGSQVVFPPSFCKLYSVWRTAWTYNKRIHRSGRALVYILN